MDDIILKIFRSEEELARYCRPVARGPANPAVEEHHISNPGTASAASTAMSLT